MIKSSKKVFLIVFIFLMILLVLPITLFYVNYSINKKQQAIERYLLDQKRTADTISELVNHQFMSLINSTTSILSDERIIDDINDFDESDPNGMNQKVDLFRRLKSIKSVASYVGGVPIIDDVLVVSRNKDVVVTGGGWFNKKGYQEAYYENHNVNLNFTNQTNHFPINILSFCLDEKCQNKTCLTSVPVICSVYGSSPIDVVFLINKNKFQVFIDNLVENSFQGHKISLNNEPVYTIGTMLDDENAENYKKYNYSTLSTHTNINYSFTFFKPHIPFLNDNIFMTFILIFTACLILALLLSLLWARPVNRIYQRISQALNKESKEIIVNRHILTNPAAVFETYIERMVTSHEQLTSKVKRYQNIMDTNNLLLSILLTEDAEDYLDEIIEICPWFSEESTYCVLLINNSSTKSDKSAEKSVVEEQISKVLDEYQKNGFINYHFMNVLISDFAVLLSYVHSDAQTIITQLCDEIEKSNSNNILSVGQSEQGIIGIQTSYYQARKMLQQRNFNTTEVIDGYFFPVNLEFQFINSLKTADKEKSKNILSTVFRQNDNLNLTPVQIKKLYQVIFESFERFSKENEYEFGDIKNEFLNSLDNGFIGTRDLLLSLCNLLSEFTLQKMNEGTQRLSMEIYDYIRENFSDVNLCADSIANHFHISRSTLYKIMRSISEVSLTELINKLRINKAIALIEENSDTITNISKQVGYDSYCTFKRIFIKNTGISPSECRNGI